MHTIKRIRFCHYAKKHVQMTLNT